MDGLKQAGHKEFNDRSAYRLIALNPNNQMGSEYLRIKSKVVSQERKQTKNYTTGIFIPSAQFYEPIVSAIKHDARLILKHELPQVLGDKQPSTDVLKYIVIYGLASLSVIEDEPRSPESDQEWILNLRRLIRTPNIDHFLLAEGLKQYSLNQSPILLERDKYHLPDDTEKDLLKFELMVLSSFGSDAQGAFNFVSNSSLLKDGSHPLADLAFLRKTPKDLDLNFKTLHSIATLFHDEILEDKDGEAVLSFSDEPTQIFYVGQIYRFSVTDEFFLAALNHSDELTLKEKIFVLTKIGQIEGPYSNTHKALLQSLIGLPPENLSRYAARLLSEANDLTLTETDVGQILEAKPILSKEGIDRISDSIALSIVPSYIDEIKNDPKALRLFISKIIARFNKGTSGQFKRIQWNENDKTQIEKLIKSKFEIDSFLETELGYSLLAVATDVSDSQLISCIKWLRHSQSAGKEAIKSSILQNTSLERLFALTQKSGRLDPSFDFILEFISDSNPSDAYSTAVSMLRLIESATPEQMPTLTEITARFINKNQVWSRLAFDTQQTDAQDIFLIHSIVGLLYLTENTPGRSAATKALVFSGRAAHHPLCDAVKFKEERETKAKSSPNIAAIQAPGIPVSAEAQNLKFLSESITQRNASKILNDLRTRKIPLNSIDDNALQNILLLPALSTTGDLVADLSPEEIALRDITTKQISLAQILRMLSSARQSVVSVAADVLSRRISTNQDLHRLEDRATLFTFLTSRLDPTVERRSSSRDLIFGLTKTMLLKLSFAMDRKQFAQISEGLSNYLQKAKIKASDVRFLIRFIAQANADDSTAMLAFTKSLMALPKGRLPSHDEIKAWQVWNAAYHQESLAPYKGIAAYLLFDFQGFQGPDYQGEIKRSIANLERSGRTHLSAQMISAINNLPPYRFGVSNFYSTQLYFTYSVAMVNFKADEHLKSLLSELQAERQKPQLDPKALSVKINTLMEEIGMVRTILYELSEGRHPIDVSNSHLGYDIYSVDLRTGKVRNIEVKAKFKTSTELYITKHELNTAEQIRQEGRSSYHFYIPTIYAGDRDYSLNGVEVFRDPYKEHIRNFVIQEEEKTFLVRRSALNAFRVPN